MAHVEALRCRECAKTFPVSPIYTCEWCFGPAKARVAWARGPSLPFMLIDTSVIRRWRTSYASIVPRTRS